MTGSARLSAIHRHGGEYGFRARGRAPAPRKRPSRAGWLAQQATAPPPLDRIGANLSGGAEPVHRWRDRSGCGPRSHERAPPSPPADAPAHDRSAINRLLLFFALVYVVEGVGQVGGLIAQPLSYYLKEVHGWTRSQVTAYLDGLQFSLDHKAGLRRLFRFRAAFRLSAEELSDCRQYRRDRRLPLDHAALPRRATWFGRCKLTAYAMAISSTVCGAVLVENGQRLGESGRFVNQQWLWFNVAAMASGHRRRSLVQWLPPTHGAARRRRHRRRRAGCGAVRHAVSCAGGANASRRSGARRS